MTLTVGMIGLGIIARNHIGALSRLAGFRISCVCDCDPEKTNAWSHELSCRGVTDYRDLISENPDVVVICLPHALHGEASLAALAGGSHVIVEKPMALSFAECGQMIAAAAQHGRQLFVAEQVCLDAGARRTGEKFRTGDLGRFFTGGAIHGRHYFHDTRPEWFLDPGLGGGGMFANLAPHKLALTRTSLPTLRPCAVSASVSRVAEYAVEGCTSAWVRYIEGGSMVYEMLGYYRDWKGVNSGTHFVFENGIVDWDRDAWRLTRRDGSELTEPLEPGGDSHDEMYARILREINGEHCWPDAAGCALDVAIIEAAYTSAREGREVALPAVGAGPDSLET